MFERAAKYVWEKHPLQPFLFMEADTTPIRPDWLRDITAAYVANGLPFMGADSEYFRHAQRVSRVPGWHQNGGRKAHERHGGLSRQLLWAK